MRQAEPVICDRFTEEYKRIGKTPPCGRKLYYRWRVRECVPSTVYLQAAAMDGCDVYYILTGRRKADA